MSLWITSNVAIPPMTSNVAISYQTMDISGHTKPAEYSYMLSFLADTFMRKM